MIRNISSWYRKVPQKRDGFIEIWRKQFWHFEKMNVYIKKHVKYLEFGITLKVGKGFGCHNGQM